MDVAGHHTGHHHNHAHDSAVSSISIVSEGTIDLDEVIFFSILLVFHVYLCHFAVSIETRSLLKVIDLNFIPLSCRGIIKIRNDGKLVEYEL